MKIFRDEPEPVSAGDCVRETPCDLCDAVDFAVAARFDRLGRELPTVVCRKCGLVSHLAIPSDEELLRYYQREYRREYHGQTVPAPHRVVRAWRQGERLVRLLSPFLEPRDDVFEIGAGIGCNVKQFELAGYNSSGIEPGMAFQAFSREQLAARVEPGIWSELKPRPRYKLVLLVHVIEHLNSPRSALKFLRRLLLPGGLLYVECPNLYSPHAAPRRLFHPAHVYNFTPATLGMLSRRCGYRIEHSFSSPRDRNLSLLLARAPLADETLDHRSHGQTLEALSRYNSFTYHLRSSYLRERVKGMARNLSDHYFASRRVRHIVELCQSKRSSAEELSSSMRRAA